MSIVTNESTELLDGSIIKLDNFANKSDLRINFT